MSSLLEQLLAQPIERADGTRARARQRLAGLGLPTAKSEAWRYTPLRTLLARNFAAPIDDDEALPELAEQMQQALNAIEPDFVYVDGILQEGDDEALDDGEYEEVFDGFDELPDFQDAELEAGQPYSRLHPEFLDDGFELANIAFNHGGLILDVEADDESDDDGDVLTLAYVNSAAAASFPHLRHRIRVAAGQRLTVIEHFLHEPGSAQALNLGHEIEVETGARLTWIRLGDMGDGNQVLGFARLRLAEDARLDLFELARGAGLYRQFTQVDLSGDRARCAAAAVLAVNGKRHADVLWRVDHRALNTLADLNVRGLAEGRGKLAFTGSLIVHAGADGSDTRLSNKNLLLSEHAEVNSKPVLEIDADEVKAAHGATVGQLDERALFYLRSRGLPDADARHLLTRAFAYETLSGFADHDWREALAEALTDLFPESP